MAIRARLSPNQSRTTKFPIVGEREPAPFTPESWELILNGLVRRPLRWSLVEFMQLPMIERVWDTICVTGWTHFDHRWGGVLLASLLDLAEPLPEAHYVRFAAYSRRKHDTSLPLDYAREHVMLATTVDGAPLTPGHGAPVRTVPEGKYFYKGVKWLRQIELLAEDKLGYWERTSAYHNDADPWLEQRYDPQPMDTAEFARRLLSRDFRGAQAIMDDQFARLRGHDLHACHFEGAQIKACDLGGAILSGAFCHGANFTRTRFVDADLRGADLSACDCEGADFRGADLRAADLRGAFLTVTQFAHAHRPARIAGARFLRTDLENEGLADEERAFLLAEENGALIE